MIELRTLGGVDLRSAADDITLPLTAQPKRLALLVFLSLEELSGYRRRDQVVGLFWPELDTVHARGALRQALHALRRAMGEGAILTRGEQEIGVNREALWCDAEAFRGPGVRSVDRGDPRRFAESRCRECMGAGHGTPREGRRRERRSSGTTGLRVGSGR